MAGTKHVQLKQGKNRRWYFSVINANGRKTETSQGYKHRRHARAAARRDAPGLELRG